MSAEILPKRPPRVRLSNGELCELSKERLRIKFGARTHLGKFDLSAQVKNEEHSKHKNVEGFKPLWQVLQFESAVSYKIHGSGKSARAALIDAGLEGWIEDAERGQA